MGIIAAGQITVVDLSDAPVLNTFITASRPTTQTYSKDSRTYKPSYASTPQVLTLKVTKAGSTANIIDSISSLHWFVVDGPIKTEITSKDNSANEYISGTHNEILTTKLDIDLNKGSKRYEVMGIWPDPSTGLDVQFGGYIDLLLTQNGATGPQGPQGDTGNGIANTVITYGLSMSDTTEPATWSSERPALVKGMYLWTRTVIIYTNGSSTTSYQISYIAKDADATAEIDKTKQELLEKLETVRDDSLAAVDEAKQQLVTVRDESLAAAEEAKQGLINVNTKVDNAKEELTQAKQDLANVASELNTAKQDLTDSVTAVNNKVDNAKEELTQAKQQLTTVADDLSQAKTDFQNAVSAVDTKATNLKNDLTQAKQDLASQAQQLQEQASAQSELTNRVSSVEKTANGTKTTVGELSKTVAQNGKDITSVTARTKVVEDDLTSTKTTLSQVKTTADSTSQKTATLETGLNGLSARFDSLKIGSVNLLKNSKTFTGSNITGMSAILNENYQGCAVRYFKNTNPNSNYQDLANFLSCVIPKSEGEYVVSFWAKGSGTTRVFFYIGLPVGNFVTSQGVSGNPVDGRATFTLSEKWQRYWVKYKLQATTEQQTVAKNLLFRHDNNRTEDEIWLAGVQLEEGNIATDYSPNEADLEQKVAEYKQNADQNYASLQNTVQNLDGTVQHNKTVAEQTAAGFKTRIESLETYKDGESERANAYFESAKTETAKQLTAERTAIAKDYVAKSTYTSDVTGIRNELSATTSTANATKTNLANYQASNDRAVANLQTNMQTANGNISSLQTKVEAVPGQITSAVSSVESKIPTSIGARNYIRNYGLTATGWTALKPAWKFEIISDSTAKSGQYLKATCTTASTDTGGFYKHLFDFSDGRFFGKQMTWAMDIKTSKNTKLSIGCEWGNAQSEVNTTENWQRFSKTFKVATSSSHKAWTFYGSNWNVGDIVYIRDVQLEDGSIATSPVPAIEDTQSDITKLSSELTQTKDGITLLATKTEVNSAKSELQSGINTATNKANAAQNTANNNAQTISTHTTQISALNTGLSAKVSQTDFNTLSGRVTTAENNITAKANELSSKITSVEGAIEDTQSDITKLSSEIKQTADGMTLLATKTELNSAKSDLQSGISTATNKANAAQSTADSAVTKANAAQNAANNNAQTISTHTTQISALNTGLQAKVSQTDFNTLSGRVTTAENNITAKANELSSKITSVEGKIPTSIGGRNYLRGTSDKYKTYTSSNYILGYANSGGTWDDMLNPLRGKTVTVRAYIKNDTDYPVRIQIWSTGGGIYGNLVPAHEEGWSVGTGKMPADWTSANVAFTQPSSTATGGTIKAKEAKLEIGNIPTDWSPAPEDTATQISNLSSEIKQTADGMTLLATKTELNTAKNDLQSGINTAINKANSAQSTANNAQNKANSNAQTISTHTTQISALNTGLQAKVSQSEFNTLSGRVTSAENNITAKANELSSKITSVEGKIPTNVGARNYIRNYGLTATDWTTLKPAWKFEIISDSTAKSGQYLKATCTTASTGMGGFYKHLFDFSDGRFFGKQMTWSMDVKTSKNTKLNIGCEWGNAQDNVNTTENWQRFSKTFKVATSSNQKAWIFYGKNWNVGDIVYIRDVQLEDGSIATSPVPAIEDTASDITKLSSELTQTKDGITLLATKTELSTAKNELQSGINTAANKANAAQNTANNNAQTISTHTTQISALNTGLQAKVSQTDFNTLSGRVTTAENNITAKANELSSKITSVEGKIPTSVGGRNYLRGTSDKYKTYTSSNYVLGYANSGGTWDDMLNPLRGKTVTVRAYIKNDTNFPVRIQVWSNTGVVYGNAIPAHSEGWSVGTGKMPADWTSANVAFTQTGNGTNNGGTIQAKEAKLEIGNIPSDWSPAPEDTISQISSLSSELKQTKDGITLLATKTELSTAKNELQSGINTATNKANAAQNTANNNAQTISTHTTQISALNTGLQAKVSQTDFNTLSGRVTTAENNITAKANELSSKITSVEGKIPTNVGARNYIRNYGLTATDWTTLKPAWKFEIISDSTAKSGQYLKATCTTASTDLNGFYKNLFDFSDGRFFDKQMTWSMDVKTSKNTKLTIGCEWGNAQSEVNTTTNWQRFSKTFKVATSSNRKAWTFYGRNWNVGDIVYIRDVQLEDGSIATSPVPAIEDTASDINTLSSQIKQTADGITLLATKTELNTAKNELQSGINTATNKANAAQNTANNAQNKANNNAQTISTHTTQISALNTGLQAKVSQTDFNTLSGRVTTAENNITAKANELSSKITSVEGKIPTNVGARNYIRNYGLTATDWTTLKPAWKFEIISDSTAKSGQYLKATCTTASTGTGGFYKHLFDFSDGRFFDKQMTWSMDVKTSKNTKLTIGCEWGNAQSEVNTTENWQRFSKTFKVATSSNRKAWIFYGKNWNAGDIVYIRDVQLEDGSIATSPVPAIEDTKSDINALSSEFKQTTDSIKASVSSLDKSTVKSSSLTINSDGIVMKAGKSTTDVANAIGSYFAVNQNAINLFSDKINVKGSMIVNGTITGDKIKASSVDVSKIVGIDANFIKSKIEYAMIDWLKGKTITAYNGNMTIDLQNGRISFKDGSNAVYRQTSDGIHTGFLHFEAGSQGGVYAAFGTTSTRQGINSKSSEFAGIRCYRVSANGDSHDAKIDKIEVIGDTVQFGHTYHPNGTIGGGFIMQTAAYYDDPPYSLNRMVSSIESLWRILYVHGKNVGYNLSHPNFINALKDEYNAWHDMHNR